MKWSIYSKRSILKSNIEIIKLFVERWRRVYVPDKSLIYNMLNSGSEENIGKSEISARITGLQLLGVVIANGFPFFDPSHDIPASSSASSQLRSESQLAEALVENLASPSKDIRSAAAEVIGLVLQSKLPTSEDGSAKSDEMEVVEDSCDSVIVPSSQIISPISSLASQPPSFSQQRQQQQQQQAKGRPRSRLEVLVELKVGGMFTCDVALALTSLFKIGTHCPSFVANFASHVFNVLPKVSGELRAMALEVIKWSLPQIDDLPRRLRLSGAEALLRYRDSDSQAFLLEIYRRVLPTLAPDEASRIVDTLCDVFPAHPSQTCRGLYYDVLTALYDKGGNVLRDRVRAPLLVGLADKSSQVRERLLEFWASEDRLGETPSERLVLLMKQGFTPKIENAWLGCATILLLRLCTSSEQKVFDKPLSNCAFRDVDISSNTLLRRAAPIFTPMFSVSASLALQSSALGSSEALWSENNGFVRATQDVIFTPTQAGPMDIDGGSGGSSSIVDLDYEDSQSSRYKSTLLFNYGTAQRGDSTHQSLKRRRGDSDENEEQEPQQQQQQQQQQQSQQYTFLRRRFNPAQATQDIIASVLRRKRVKDARAALAESGKASSVVMMRKYREGELPDIEIKPADILKPLCVLVQHDQVIARYAFYELSNLVLRTVADRDTLSEVSEAVKAMLDESPCTNPSFVSVLHDVLEVVLNKSGGTIIVPPQTVAQSAARSGALHTGILLLENTLSALAVAAAAAQRGGEEEEMRDPEEMGPDPEAALKENTEQCWSQLAQLYRRAGETDVVKGIYEKNFSKQPQTIRALEYELVGRYDKALSEFNDALRILDAHGPWPGGKSPSTSECDLWENGRLDCMAKLLQWKPLSDNVLAEVSPGYSGADGEALPPVQTLRKLFDEKYSDVYLGHFVKSQLRLRERWSYLKEFVVASSSISDSTDVAAAAQKRRGLLEDKFGPDLTLLTIAGGDLDNARYAVRRNVSEFVGSWARLHPLAVEARRESLEVLQRITEARELLDACKRRGSRGGEACDSLALQGLLDKWHARTPVVPDISTWDDIASARSVYLEQLSDRYEGVVGKSYFVKEKSNVLYAMAEAAKRFGNLSVCDNYLRMALKLNPDKRDKDFRFIMTSVDLFVLKDESRAGRDEAERFAKALKFVLSKEALPVVQADIANQRKFSSAVGGLYAKLVGVLSEVPDYNAVAPTVSAVLGCRGGPGLTDELAGKALGYLEASISDSTTLSNKVSTTFVVTNCINVMLCVCIFVL